MRAGLWDHSFYYGRGIDDPNMIIGVIDKMEDVMKIRFSTLPSLELAMKAGVMGRNQIWVL
jgi:hypothetical protein